MRHVHTKRHRLAAVAIAAAVGVVLTFAGGAAQAATGSIPLPPFSDCPSVGAAPSCGVLLVVNADSTVSVYGDTAVGTYDGADDTLVGIRNNSGGPVSAVTVSGPGSALAGFDGDGLCAFGVSGCPFGTTGYEGPGTKFVIDPTNADTLEVDFPATLAPNTSTYFSLEGALTSAALTARRGHLDGSSDNPCSDLYFLGAAGSGQTTSPSDVDLGYGAQVHSAYQRLVGDVGGSRRVEGHALQYTAAGVGLLGYAPGVYFDSISAGVALAEAKVHLVRTLCPHEHIVLAGYSQGAMVMHRVIQHLVATGDSGSLAHLDGALLIADGDRVRSDNTTNWGNATPIGKGIGQFLPAISGSNATKFPAFMAPRMHRICNLLDPVCDDVAVPKAVTLALRLPIHLGYTGKAPLVGAVDAVAAEVRTTPAPAASLADLAARAGVPYSFQLTADVDPSFSLQWQLVAPSALPPGWTMSGGGVVSGTTSYVGTWTSQLQVRAVILGVTGEWIPTTVGWTITP